MLSQGMPRKTTHTQRDVDSATSLLIGETSFNLYDKISFSHHFSTSLPFHTQSVEEDGCSALL